MGNTVAMGFASAVNDGLTSLDSALHYHLTCNHYPPLPSSLVGPAKRAIQKANRGEWDANVSLRDTDVTHNRYGKLVPVSVLVEGLHLDAFLEPDEDYYEDDEE